MSVGLSRRRRRAVRRIRWTKNQFYQMLDMGMFTGRRVELIDGEIIEMATQKNFHALGIKLLDDKLNEIFGPGYWVRVQMTLDLSPYSVLDPDLAVIKGKPRDHARPENPTMALLVVEVSDTTLRYDRKQKLGIYACAGIKDYWILNLVNRELEVYRKPVPDPKGYLGYGYDKVMLLQEKDAIAPLAAPRSRIIVADVMP